jgi:hypothetical protein
VEAQRPAQGLHPLGRDVDVRAEHDHHGVAGDQAEHQEDQHRDPEQHEHEVEQAADDVARHAGTPLPSAHRGQFSVTLRR